jgi:glycosyltransferase involved in cell wall biosynthesis
MGQVSRENVFEMYSKSVLLFPSFVESFGLPLLEARLSECIIIASSCPFCREILDGYDKVSYFEPMEYRKMGKLINEVAC